MIRARFPAADISKFGDDLFSSLFRDCGEEDDKGNPSGKPNMNVPPEKFFLVCLLRYFFICQGKSVVAHEYVDGSNKKITKTQSYFVSEYRVLVLINEAGKDENIMKWYFQSEFRLKAEDVAAKASLGSGTSEAQSLLDPETAAAARLSPCLQWFKKMTDNPEQADGTDVAGLMRGGSDDEGKTVKYVAAYKQYLNSDSPTNPALINKDLTKLNRATDECAIFINIIRKEFGGKDVQEKVYAPMVSVVKWF